MVIYAFVLLLTFNAVRISQFSLLDCFASVI